MPPKHLALALLAAIAAAAPLPQLRVEAVTAGSVFYVKNTADQPLTAYTIELVDYPGSSFWMCQDEAASPIAPGAEKRIPVTNMTVGAAPEYVKITAAVYADGSTAGAPEKVAQIVERRKSILETTREALRRVRQASQSGAAKPAVIADLKQWAASLQPEGKSNRMTQARINQQAAHQVASNTIAYLDAHSLEETAANLETEERKLAALKP
jgi:hypothetical protein